MTAVNSKQYNESVEKARELLKSYKLPVPAQPDAFEEEYRFPTDPAAISAKDLGSLMMKLAAYRGYCARLLAIQESTLQTLESVYQVILGYDMYLIQREDTKYKLVKEQMIGIAINNNDDLRELFKLKVQKEQLREHLKAQLAIYDGQWQALSRELSRREMEMKSLVAGRL